MRKLVRASRGVHTTHFPRGDRGRSAAVGSEQGADLRDPIGEPIFPLPTKPAGRQAKGRNSTAMRRHSEREWPDPGLYGVATRTFGLFYVGMNLQQMVGIPQQVVG
jgi:hypothetical protein